MAKVESLINVLLSQEEKEILLELGAIWNRYIKLDELHPNDKQDFLNAIHVCQNIIYARPVISKWRCTDCQTINDLSKGKCKGCGQEGEEGQEDD